VEKVQTPMQARCYWPCALSTGLSLTLTLTLTLIICARSTTL